jgi:predicted DNA-binding protein YlxM (UPF0122 family)
LSSAKCAETQKIYNFGAKKHLYKQKIKKCLTSVVNCGILCKGFCFTGGGRAMFEKNLALVPLLDWYGTLLSDRHRNLLELYYNQDLSLAEIAAEVGISRQGVRDGIKKAEEELFFFERNLHLAARAEALLEKGREMERAAQCEETRTAVRALLDAAGLLQ